MDIKVFLIFKTEVTAYPPILTIIQTLSDLGYIPVVIGTFEQETVRKFYISKGMQYFPTSKYDPKANFIDKLIKQLKYKKEVTEILSEEYREGDYIWIFNLETMMLLDSLVSKYKTILHFFEFVGESFNWKYRLLNPTYSMTKTVSCAYKVVHCEYNRAQISKGLYCMKKLPEILPNKPYLSEDIFNSIPDDISKKVAEISDRILNRKVILYQGAFTDGERRLDDFCEAMSMLPDDFIFVGMGAETAYLNHLKTKYAHNDKVLFMGYLPAPYHLLITRTAYIGILTYFPLSANFVDVINPIYCAPNKIFEYSYFKKPMIGNDIPGLKYPFEQYHCGMTVSTPLSASAIADTIIQIDNDYNIYSDGAVALYRSVDIPAIINGILN